MRNRPNLRKLMIGQTTEIKDNSRYRINSAVMVSKTVANGFHCSFSQRQNEASAKHKVNLRSD
ncbi:hypothetical protein SAMN06264855_12141 [Halorubrum vacuolatum]|uniref:Uncharacterized protein n=1 Tax=Halorubrum vacuolatum TaxID=63740 RepID=A0A238XQ84_HALVU|nr:hypothetical protein SAMN06264855_12141 [Halorubrum vacuolatum]